MPLHIKDIKLSELPAGGMVPGETINMIAGGTVIGVVGSGVGKSCVMERMFAHMQARNDMVENLYKKMEEHLPCEPLSDELLATMNWSMGFPTEGPHAKGQDYRPYCCREGCEYMPRMMRVREGFMCWSCKGKWELNDTLKRQKEHEAAQASGT